MKTHLRRHAGCIRHPVYAWIPAFAGMTINGKFYYRSNKAQFKYSSGLSSGEYDGKKNNSIFSLFWSIQSLTN
jgi:hypothetical protein